jgi:hypothetical protein
MAWIIFKYHECRLVANNFKIIIINVFDIISECLLIISCLVVSLHKELLICFPLVVREDQRFSLFELLLLLCFLPHLLIGIFMDFISFVSSTWEVLS